MEVAARRTLLGLRVVVTARSGQPVAASTLGLDADESYELELGEAGEPVAVLTARTIIGAIWGLEVFTQLVVSIHLPEPAPDAAPTTAVYLINSTVVKIADAPRFRWRGVMVDTARHYQGVETLKRMIDALSYNRFNVLHWHITDSQSFPLRLNALPKLAEGAYRPDYIYTPADVRGLVAYAADRNVRVVPEIDSPGHSAAWFVGYPELGVEGVLLDPVAEGSFALLNTLFGELAQLFDDEYVHIGCDEVPFALLNESAPVVAYMAEHGIPRTNVGFKRVVAGYIERLAQIVKAHGKTPIAWQEAMDHYGPTQDNPTPPAPGMPRDLVIEQWLDPVWNWANISAITGTGYYGRPNVTWPHGFQALSTQGWYLDADSNVNSWQDRYAVEPLTNKSCVYSDDGMSNCSCACPEGPWRDGNCYCYDLRSDPARAAMVLGGEACLWGEHIDGANLFPRAFPRASAVAERLWSPMARNNATAAAPRLWRQRCRMLARGVPVTPLGPGYC